jgi:hypothetical protein
MRVSTKLNNKDLAEEPLTEPTFLPVTTRWVIGSIAAGVCGLSIILMWIKELQLGALTAISFSVLIVVILPLEQMGIRVRKIGAVEFEQVVRGQAREHAEDFVELQTRIAELEGRVQGLDETASLMEGFTAQELRPLLLKFLGEFQPRAFSPVKIHKWGARQEGFEKLAQYTQGQIRRVLQGLLSEGEVATRVSKLGNTLYKVPD